MINVEVLLPIIKKFEKNFRWAKEVLYNVIVIIYSTTTDRGSYVN
jgi:hypothetical protein